MNKLVSFAALIALTLGLGLTGCKSAEEKACANMIEIMKKENPEAAEGEDGDVDKCVEMLKEDDDKCKDRDAALDCMAEASDSKGLMECGKHCE